MPQIDLVIVGRDEGASKALFDIAGGIDRIISVATGVLLYRALSDLLKTLT